ncbi:hypothetical protein LguiA_035569 [Lonicera macranthoides]
MGGGGAMRAAAKVAGFGVVNTSLRGFPSSSPSEHSFTSATRRSKRAVVSSSPDETLNGNIEDSSVQKPLGEIGDWEFAGGNEEMFVGESGEYMPRLVFGGVPTLDEAQVATSELKEALEKTYLSPKSTGWTGSLISNKESGLQRLSNDEYLETKACVTTSDTTLTPVVPKHAMQAFMFLNQSAAAQSVVASIASDPNVWGAVMQNPELVGFLKSYNTSSVLEKEESVDAGFQDEHIPKDKSPNNDESGTGSWFTDSVKNIRLVVVEMMSGLSGYFQNIFGSPVGGKVPKEADGSDKISFVHTTLGASFMGLAIMVIMVVVLKRG